VKKKINIFIGILTVILCFLIGIIYFNNRQVLSIKNEIKYYVSTEGDDSFSGQYPGKTLSGKDGPFRTIEKAKNAARERLASGANSNITILIRGGQYFVNSSIEFDHRDSGKEGYQITYKNYNDEEVIISTGEKIDNWEEYNEHIYRTFVGNKNFKALYENGERSIQARYPNNSYSTVKNIVSNSSKLKFQYYSEDIPQEVLAKEFEVCIWPGGANGKWNWFFDKLYSVNNDTKEDIITLNNKASLDIGKGSRYYIQGALELLDSPGEFYLDKESGYLYYWPYKEPIHKQEIISPSSDNIIFINAEEKNYVRNISFEGLSFCNTDETEQLDNKAVIHLGNNCENIAIKNCKIYNSGAHGILLSRWSQKNLIYGNSIYNVGYDGVRLEDDGLNGYINKQNSISNNYIHDAGQIVRHGNGIFISNSGENRIANNKIKNIPRDGIKVVYSKNNVIEFNDISNCIEDSQDAGLIGLWGTGWGNIINNNYLHDSDVPFSFAAGVYIDDGSDYATIKNNIITRLQKQNDEGTLHGAIYVKGVGNEVINNIIADNQRKSININTFEMAGQPNNNVVIKNNIIFNSGEYLYNFDNWDKNRFKYADYNLFYNDEEKYRITGVPGVKSYKSWTSILNKKYDQHSLMADPQFADAANGDYSLKPNSPAYSLGFKDINFKNIGLLPDFKH
jgi:parallel beta-helix repeat protein